jgi:CHASE3 domain sensor protein
LAKPVQAAGEDSVSHTLKQLREIPNEELVRLHDEIAVHTQVGVDYYLSELARRDAAAQTRQMLLLTWVIAIFTAVVTAAAILSLFVD